MARGGAGVGDGGARSTDNVSRNFHCPSAVVIACTLTHTKPSEKARERRTVIASLRQLHACNVQIIEADLWFSLTAFAIMFYETQLTNLLLVFI